MRSGDALPVLEVPITARTVVMGAASSRDWQPQHHDHTWAVERAGTRDIFLNTPNQAGWIERYLTDWSGLRGRLGRLRFRMRRPVFPGETLVFRGTITGLSDDGFADVDVTLSVGDEVATECSARIALPRTEGDNPWARAGEDWSP